MQNPVQTDQNIEDAQHSRDQLFEAIAAHSLAGIIVAADNNILYANRAASEIYGHSIEMLMGNGILAYLHESDIDRVRGYYERRTKGSSAPPVYEFRIIRGDGEVRWIQSRVCVISWLGQNAICMSQIDITTERANVYELESDKSLLYEVIEQSPDGMCIADASKPYLPIIFANNAFYEITGYNEEDVLDQSCSIVQGPLTSVETLIELRQCLDEGRQFVGDILNYRKNGETFWNRLSISPVFNATGKLTYFVSSQVDITEAKLSRERIDYLQLALDQLTEQVSILDNDDRYIYVNNAIEELLERTEDDLRGKPIRKVLSEGVYDEHLYDYFQNVRNEKEFTRLFNQDDLLRGTVSERTPDYDSTPQYVEYSTSPIKDDAGELTALVVVSRDKSEEVNTQIALADSEKRFRNFVEIAADWYWESDLNGVFTFLSPTMKNFLENLSDPPASSLEQLWKLSHSDAKFTDIEEIVNSSQPFTQESIFAVDGEDIYMHMQGRPLIVNGNTVEGFRGIASNLSLQRRMEADLRVRATQDELTGLLNRREFQTQFNHILLEKRDDFDELSLMYIDVDRLKFINDSFGHAAGDELIRRVAEVLRGHTHALDCHVARIGGDEFVILFRNLAKMDVEQLGRKMVEAVDNFYLFESKTDIRPGLSIGVVHIDSSCSNSEIALAKADIACYQTKQRGGRNVGIYSESDSDYEQRMQSNQIQIDIRRALDGDGFEPYLQPIVEIANNRSRVHSFELLLRMRDSNGNLVQPYDFINAAESYGYIADIDRWVITNAIQLLEVNSNSISLSINISGSTLADPGLSNFIMREIHSYDVDASCLIFEITETAAIAQIDYVVSLIDALSALGCRFVLDDFGSGLSSFKYIQNFKVSGIKIDGCFIQALSENKSDPMIVSSMVTLAQNLKLDIVAEWVEDEQTLLRLLDIGITKFQGFFFARPQPAETVLKSAPKHPANGAVGAPLSHNSRVLKSTA